MAATRILSTSIRFSSSSVLPLKPLMLYCRTLNSLSVKPCCCCGNGGSGPGTDGGQQGPVHFLIFSLSLDDLRPEHLTWSQFKQDVHWTDVVANFLLQSLHNQIWGPGFCSMPALISRSRSNWAGRGCSFVKLLKNSSLLRDRSHCQHWWKTSWCSWNRCWMLVGKFVVLDLGVCCCCWCCCCWQAVDERRRRVQCTIH